MNATRRARLASVIQQELSTLIQRELKDPRIPLVSITSVEVAEDGSHANVFVGILGEDTPDYPERMRECLAGLVSSAGFLRKSIARALTIRHIPTLSFKEDRGLRNVTRVHELLRQISSEKGSA